MLPLLAGIGLACSMQTHHEPLRPQFHFTSAQNWLNDPNGLVFYKGDYHLFFQHNPFGTAWGNMTWGHAISKDLVHWTQLADAIKPDSLGTIFSGSAVVNWDNTSGFQVGSEKPIVCIYACAGDTSPESKGKPFTECLAYSTDGGKTFSKYNGNPVVGEIAKGNRDPKVVWFEPKKQWVMAMYLEGNDYALLRSPDLVHWTQLQRIKFPGADECPDFFRIPVEGRDEHKWVLVGANGHYLVGSFDGDRFKPDQEPAPMDLGPNFYAVQTYSDIPPKDGRRIQIAWMRGGAYPGMPFNQQMSFPCVLTLHATAEGYRIHRNPVRELSKLSKTVRAGSRISLSPSSNYLAGLSGDLWDLNLSILPGHATAVNLNFRGANVSYDVATQILIFGDTKVGWPLDKEGHLELEALIDTTSVELFGNGGALSFSACFLPKLDEHSLDLEVIGPGAELHLAKINRIDSVYHR